MQNYFHLCSKCVKGARMLNLQNNQLVEVKFLTHYLDTLSWWDEISHSYKVKHFCSKWGSSVLIITLITSQTFLITIWITIRQWDAKLLWPIFAIIFDTSFATTKKVHNRFRFLSSNSAARHPAPWTNPSKIFTTKRLRVQRGQVLPLRKSMVRTIAIQHQHGNPW